MEVGSGVFLRRCMAFLWLFRLFHHLLCGLSRQTSEDFDALYKFIYYFYVSKGWRFVVRHGLVWSREGSGHSLVWSREGSWRSLVWLPEGPGAEPRTRSHSQSCLKQQLCCPKLVSYQLTCSHPFRQAKEVLVILALGAKLTIISQGQRLEKTIFSISFLYNGYIYGLIGYVYLYIGNCSGDLKQGNGNFFMKWSDATQWMEHFLW